MGIYIRKAFKLGSLIRLNLSKYGIGVSVGAKGFRIGRDAAGTPYIHAGRKGLYYRRNLPPHLRKLVWTLVGVAVLILLAVLVLRAT